MFGKILVSSCLIVSICHVSIALSPDTQTISREDNRFDIAVGDKKVAYRIGLIILDYTPDVLTINRNKDSNSADITITKSFVMLINGNLADYENWEPYKEYGFVKNQYINVKIDGSAKLAADGQHLENCEFKWSQTLPIYKNLLKDAVRDALLENFDQILGEKLCASLNKTITKYSV